MDDYVSDLRKKIEDKYSAVVGPATPEVDGQRYVCWFFRGDVGEREDMFGAWVERSVFSHLDGKAIDKIIWRITPEIEYENGSFALRMRFAAKSGDEFVDLKDMREGI